MRRRKARATTSVSDHCTDAAVAWEFLERSLRAYEDSTCRAAWATVPQVLGQGFPHVVRNGESVLPFSFPADRDYPRLPIDVIQGQGQNLGGTQSQSRHQEQDRVVPPPHR